MIATGGGQREQALEFRQNQIEDLRGAHFQGALLEEIAQGIGCLVTRNLQDAFIHGIDHHLRRAVGFVADTEGLSRLGEIGRVERDLRGAFGAAHRERGHTVGQGTHENFVGVDAAHEGHRDIAIAL